MSLAVGEVRKPCIPMQRAQAAALCFRSERPKRNLLRAGGCAVTRLTSGSCGPQQRPQPSKDARDLSDYQSAWST